jgi:hypothetical protein
MALLELVPAEIERRLHHDVGEFAEAVGEVLDRVHAGDVLRQEMEDLRVVGFAQDVHFALGVVRRAAPGAPAGCRETAASRW